MAPLATELRRVLLSAVVDAREAAESGAANALAVLAVEEERAPDALSPVARRLRTQLRARASSLGNGVFLDGIPELREEIAYAAWHRMLFARFLAENGLLVEPSSRVPVSMDDVAELAREHGEPDPWIVAGGYAAEMLPGIFRTAEPTTQVVLAPDDRLKLEAVLKALPTELFVADDALGWVYQFWQSKRKDEVNAAGKKISGADLAPVTQLFTEHYMVRFLLENSLGAWWAGRHPQSPLVREWEYLRFRDDGTPAAGTFEGWPARAAELTVMDPCCGSGHFLVAAADMLRKMRAEEEGSTPAQAAIAVVCDNLFGLELDARCLQLAAFNLALDAWKAGGYQPLPVPNLGCSGIAINGQRADWHRLAGGDTNMADALDRLFNLFQDAPELGSLIDPRSAAGEDLFRVDPDKLLAKLERALKREASTDPAAEVFGAAAVATVRAAQLLTRRYWLVATNPPYLGGNQSDALREFAARDHPESRLDTAAMFLETALKRFAEPFGGVCFVEPAAVLLLLGFASFRRHLLENHSLRLIAMLGAGAFSGISGEVVKVSLLVLERDGTCTDVFFIDASATREAGSKDRRLVDSPLIASERDQQLNNPGARVLPPQAGSSKLLTEHADVYQGLGRGDGGRYDRAFWELGSIDRRWARLITSRSGGRPYAGRELVFLWEDGRGSLAASANSRVQGQRAWGRPYVFVARTGGLKATLGLGEVFAENGGAIVPRRDEDLPAIWCFVRSPEYPQAVLRLSNKLVVPTATMAQVPFNRAYWTRVAAEQYPDGLPEPYSEDPTQWLFSGHVVGSEAPLQVAVARLLGYRWPDREPDALDGLTDPDGIVALPAVGGEAPAAERIEEVLATAYGTGWSPAKRAEFLAAAGGKARTLEAWLRDEFFEQHARLFHNRPFIWHVWDGRRDGFGALLHYHRLDRAVLEKLTYAHLGEWLERQRADAKAGQPGADARLKSAEDLQANLAAILAGEPPFDIYVRWKPLAEQPLGWDPDLDDGVRLNIRPFVSAGVLRSKFTINWNKDRGTDPGGSERLNDRHFTIAEKRAAREQRA